MTIIALSDVHLGYRESCNRQFKEFLGKISKRRDLTDIVICGDFLDMWRRDLAGVVLENTSILELLQTLQPKVKVYYVAGNHDYHVINFEKRYPQFLFRKDLVLEEGGTNYRFCHGYEFDPFQNSIYFDLLCYSTDDTGNIADEIWNLYIKGKSLWARIKAWFTGQKENVIHEIEMMMKPPDERLANVKETVRENVFDAVKRKEFLIFGHTHKPFLDIENSIGNLGSWTRDSKPNCTYIEIKKGKVKLLEFGKKEVKYKAFRL